MAYRENDCVNGIVFKEWVATVVHKSRSAGFTTDDQHINQVYNLINDKLKELIEDFRAAGMQLVARQGLQKFGVLVGASLQDRAVEILVDQKVAQTPRGDDADTRVARIGLDRPADGLAELIAALRPRLVRREIGCFSTPARSESVFARSAAGGAHRPCRVLRLRPRACASTTPDRNRAPSASRALRMFCSRSNRSAKPRPVACGARTFNAAGFLARERPAPVHRTPVRPPSRSISRSNRVRCAHLPLVDHVDDAGDGERGLHHVGGQRHAPLR